MNSLPVHCYCCQKILYRSKSRINEAKKFNWKTYCSSKCESKIKNKQQVFTCSNPQCNTPFKRRLRDVQKSQKLYCSQSCAATINNVKFPKRHALIRQCEFCRIDFTGREKYCSILCKNNDKTINKDTITQLIKVFYKNNGRIPLKKEFRQAKSARKRFTSWNNAVEAAGFSPNPVKFAKKHFAKDGHKCDSLAEKIIDDWLYKKNVVHARSVPYPEGKGFTADFVIGSHWIEFFGLHGEHKRYDELRKKKLQIVKKYNLNLLEIFPKDLFPRNNLPQILKF